MRGFVTSPDVARVLGRLSTRDAADAWREFLDAYAALILHVIRTGARDPDDASDCFLFVCEKLSQNKFRRLRRFRTDGPASFSTWLRAVVRNLSIDWHRKRAGRRRAVRSISRLPVLEQELFRCDMASRMRPKTSPRSEGSSMPSRTRNRKSGFPRCTRSSRSRSPRRIPRSNSRL